MFPSTPINQPNPLDWHFDMFYEEADTPSNFLMNGNIILIGWIRKIIFFSIIWYQNIHGFIEFSIQFIKPIIKLLK